MKRHSGKFLYIPLVAMALLSAACQPGVSEVSGGEEKADAAPVDSSPEAASDSEPETEKPGEDKPSDSGNTEADEQSGEDTQPSPDKATSEDVTPNDGSLVFGKDDTKPSATWTKPNLGQSYADPAYGTKVTRVSSAEGTRFNRNTYSRRQAENADGTLFMTYHGDAAYHVYEVDSTDLVAALEVHPDGEPQWHPSNPNIIRHTTGSNSYVGTLTLQETNVLDGTTTTIADITSEVKAALPGAAYIKDGAEGSPSKDGNRHAWMVYNDAEKPIGIVSYDLESDTILGTTEISESPDVDWVSMSPSGKYVVSSSDAGTHVYNADMSNKRLLTEAIEHSDIGYDADGSEAYVYIDFKNGSATAGWLVSVNMDTLDRTKIFDIYDNASSSVHISTKNYDKPGWALVSSYNCKVPGAWTCDKVFAVELKPNGRILNLAHTYNCGDDYWTETQAVVSRDFSRVYFNSDSGSCGEDAEVFRIDVPEFS